MAKTDMQRITDDIEGMLNDYDHMLSSREETILVITKYVLVRGKTGVCNTMKLMRGSMESINEGISMLDVQIEEVDRLLLKERVSHRDGKDRV